MRNNVATLYSVLLVAGDFLAILASFVFAYILRVSLDDRPLVEEIPALQYLRIFIILLPLWLIIFTSLGLYTERVYSKRFNEMFKLLLGSFVGILLLIGYEFISQEGVFPARLVAVYGFLFSFSLLVLERTLLWQFRRLMFRFGIWINRVVLIGSSKATKDIARLLNDTRTSGYDIVGIIGAQSVVPAGFEGKHFSSLQEGLASLPAMNVHTIIQTKLYETDEKNTNISNAARENHAAYKFIPSEGAFVAGKAEIELFHYFPVISVHQTPLLGWGRIAKRLFDFIFSLLSLIVLSPLFIIIAIVIKIQDPGAVFFRQERLSRYGQAIRVYKFRSMKERYSGKEATHVFLDMNRPDLAHEYQSNRSKVSNDPRVSGVGRFLRATSLDELPQLFNVLRGELSLVGPRAIPAAELADFKAETPILLSVKTGITGLAQVSGRSDISMEERIRLDLYYVQNWSFFMDVRIVFKTIWVVLGKFGAR